MKEVAKQFICVVGQGCKQDEEGGFSWAEVGHAVGYSVCSLHFPALGIVAY